MKSRATINISREAKTMLDSVKTEGQSYDGAIRELVKFWREKGGQHWPRRRAQSSK